MSLEWFALVGPNYYRTDRPAEDDPSRIEWLVTDDYEPRDDVVDEPITAPIKPDFPDDDAIDPPLEDDASAAHQPVTEGE